MSHRPVSAPTRLFRWIMLVVGFGFLYLPILGLVVFSFNDSRFPSLPWSGFTLRWYQDFLSNPDIMASLTNSLIIAVQVGLYSLILGSLGAYLVARWEFKGMNALLGFWIMPPTVPTLILALALLMYFNQLHLTGTLNAVILGHTGLASAFVVAVMRLRFVALDPNLEEASINLGFSRWATFWRVTAPQIAPGAAASFFIAMAVSWDEFVIAWFLSGFDTTLPVQMFGVLTGYVSPMINAVGTFVFTITTVLVLLALFILNRPVGDRKALTSAVESSGGHVAAGKEL